MPKIDTNPKKCWEEVYTVRQAVLSKVRALSSTES